MMESPIQAVRDAAASALKEHGTAVTAGKIDDILISNGLSQEIKRSYREVLLSLSHRWKDSLQDPQARVKRTKALSSTLSNRSLTPPYGIKAYQRS